MMAGMKRLQIPAVLVVVTLGGLGCPSPTPPTDAAGDGAQSDGAQSDVAQDSTPGDGASCTMQDASDTPPFNQTLCGRDTEAGLRSCGAPCTDGTCSDGCRVCVADQFGGGIGIACLPRAGSTASCPSRVCQASDCPSGCESCQSPLFCIPDGTLADGATPTCNSQTCDPATGCPPGCRAVG